MTEENKKNIIEYFVGKNIKETGNNIPQFIQDKIIDKTIESKLTEELLKIDTVVSTTIVGKIYNETTTNWLLYGFYRPNENDYKGFVYIMDNNANPIQVINKFSSGADMFPIVAMQQDEDNYFYCLTDDIGKTPRNRRVILLNNILSSGNVTGEYFVKIRKSYITPKQYTLTFWNSKRIQKVKNEAIYFIFTTMNAKTTIIRFTIDVESGNKWEEFQLNELITSGAFDVLMQKNGDTNELYLYGLDEYSQNTIIEYSLKGDTLTKEKSVNVGTSYSTNLSKVTIYDLNNVYICLTNTTNKVSYLKKLVNTTISQIATYNGSESPFINPMINVEKINNVLFYMSLYYNNNSYIDIGIIQNDILYKYTIENVYDYSSNAYFFNDYLITNNYNLFNIFTPQQTNETLKMQLVYNKSNYNGEKYQNVNSIKPKSGILKKNGSLIYARNIYNSVVNDNNTTTTIQIPNTILNDISITNNSLLSETNYIMNENNDEITKNIYETLYINYSNTLNIINANDNNNQIINQSGANRLNNSMYNINDYENAKASKYKIIYEDGTTIIRNITNSSVIKIDDFTYKYNFSISVNKKINKLQILSEDENNIYQEIDLKDLLINKIYTIQQRVRII